MAQDASPARLSRPLQWLATVATVVVSLLLIALFGRMFGVRAFVFAFNLHFILMGAAVALDHTWKPRLASPRFDVSPRELRIYRRLGVVGFMRLLQRIGWTRAMRDPRTFDGTRGTLASYEQATRHGEHAHTWLFVLVLAPMLWVATRGWWDAFAWLGLMNVGFHLYPVMLQRFQRARLRGLLRRVAQREPRGGETPAP